MTKHLIGLIIFLIAVELTGCGNDQNAIVANRLEKIPTSTIKITSAKDQHPPILHSNDWQKPIPLDNAINTAGAEDSPFIMPNGDTLYFFFTPNPNIPPEKQVTDNVTGIYSSQKINNQWSQAKRIILQNKNKLSLDGCEFVQNNTIWFCSAREGYTGLNWFTAEYKNNKWQNWKITSKEFKQYEVGELHFSSNGQELFFHSSKNGGLGQYDIWSSQIKDDILQPPINISAVNSSDNDGWPFISHDGQELWFTRTYLGTPSIWRSKRLNNQWQKPEMILSQFAGEPSLDNQGNIYFVHHYYKDNKMLEADIYVALKK